eukprot:UN26702
MPELVAPVRRLMALVNSMFDDNQSLVKDKIWEMRIRFAFVLLFYSAKCGSKCDVIVQEVIHPCLKVLPHCAYSLVNPRSPKISGSSGPLSSSNDSNKEESNKDSNISFSLNVGSSRPIRSPIPGLNSSLTSNTRVNTLSPAAR